MQKQNWLVTGVSTGLGRAFDEAALAAGHTVVGTVRSEEDLRAFEELRPGIAQGRLLDVTDDDAVPGAVAEVEQTRSRSGPFETFRDELRPPDLSTPMIPGLCGSLSFSLLEGGPCDDPARLARSPCRCRYAAGSGWPRCPG
ncbi:hypothetical protein SRO_7426 [Streptomyces rochei]|nr:hypothetical protein SRO_7426 [Streptomyces rochei]